MTNGTQTYKFKPALLSKAQSYFVTASQIEKANKDGTETVVRFEDITSLRYADTSAREYKFRRLDITHGNQKLMRIGVTLPFTSTTRNDKDLAAFYQLMHNIADRLSHSRPDIYITIGETARVNWIYFTIGALTLLAAVGMLLGALLSGVSDQKLMKALFPILAMAGFGAYICFTAKPWVTRKQISPVKFRKLIEQLMEK